MSKTMEWFSCTVCLLLSAIIFDRCFTAGHYIMGFLIWVIFIFAAVLNAKMAGVFNE